MMIPSTTGSYTCPYCGMSVPYGLFHTCPSFAGNVQNIPANVIVDMSKIKGKLDEIIKVLKEIRIDLVDVRIKQ